MRNIFLVGVGFCFLIGALMCLAIYYWLRSRDRQMSKGTIITGTINRAEGKTVAIASKNGTSYFFETTIHYHFLGPNGQGFVQQTATISENDSNHRAVPHPGREVAILYVDKKHFELL